MIGIAEAMSSIASSNTKNDQLSSSWSSNGSKENVEPFMPDIVEDMTLESLELRASSMLLPRPLKRVLSPDDGSTEQPTSLQPPRPAFGLGSFGEVAFPTAGSDEGTFGSINAALLSLQPTRSPLRSSRFRLKKRVRKNDHPESIRITSPTNAMLVGSDSETDSIGVLGPSRPLQEFRDSMDRYIGSKAASPRTTTVMGSGSMDAPDLPAAVYFPSTSLL
jgi:hypothetical protein